MSLGGRDLSETLEEFLGLCARAIFYLGALVVLISTGLLVYTCVAIGSDTSNVGQMADAVRNVGIFQKMLVVGLVGVGIGSSYLFWGAELLGAIQIMGAAALYFAPLYLPSIIGDKQTDATKEAYSALQLGGTTIGVIGLLVVIADVAIRIQQRMKTGAKADQLKYGKGIKEEAERQNVLLGKCWQLPFCRKFVRERCPIYLSRRTCWKELVGCMCEEQVIRGAMENKPIPKDELLAANYIPHNHKLTEAQKKERCYSCIIYNEHQKHKYKIMMPATVLTFVGVWVGLHGPLVEAVTALCEKINVVVHGATLGHSGNFKPPEFFVESMLGVFMVIGLTYAMKVIEFACFKIKI
ncbi:MAG: hypothetical protein P4L46_07950 [Fimbriimonas sp.]|nr:hypothetical protein [Fimbriimonas sp.]